MFGALSGDIIGSRFEFDRGGKTKDFTLFTGESEFTDDTVMTMAVADALMQCGPDPKEEQVKDAVIRSMQFWGRHYPNAGYGARFIHWIFTDNPHPYHSWGNGSAMRVSCAGWLYSTMEKTRNAARWTAEVTHDHPEGIKGAECTAAVIYLSRIGKGKHFIMNYVEQNFGYDFRTNVDELRKKHRHDESCMDTLPKALVSFFEGNSFEDVIRNAVSLGGDTDTIAAIAGSMAEAYYPVSEFFITECRKRVNRYMNRVLDRFETIRTAAGYSGEDPEVRRNRALAYYAEQGSLHPEDRENLRSICIELYERACDDGDAPAPCVDINDTLSVLDPSSLSQGDEVTLPQDLRLCVSVLQASDGTKYVPLFTSQEEVHKGKHTNVLLYWPIRSLLMEALEREDISGLVINPYSSSIILNKPLLKAVANTLNETL